MTLRESTFAEKPMQASKWLQSQTLLSKNEFAALFNFLENSLSPIFLFSCGIVCEKKRGEISKNEFLVHYGNYIDSLMKGQDPDLSQYREIFSSAMTLSTDALFSIPVKEDRQIIRVSKPVIQLQAHHLDYSPIDQKFHSMVFGLDSISWGIQFSYPQLFLDHATGQVETVKKTEAFPNTALFQLLQKWMRQFTIPTPFIVENKVTNFPVRLGKECFSWINAHSQLKKKDITIKL